MIFAAFLEKHEVKQDFSWIKFSTAVRPMTGNPCRRLVLA